MTTDERTDMTIPTISEVRSKVCTLAPPAFDTTASPGTPEYLRAQHRHELLLEVLAVLDAEHVPVRSLEEMTGRRECEWTNSERVALATANHVWLNAFTLVRPSDETLIEIGRIVRDRLMGPTRYMTDSFVGASPVTYIRFNAS